MKIKMKSPLTGIVNEKDLDITQEQYDNWNNGMLIQRAMPHLTSEEREFLITGLLNTEEFYKFIGE